MHEYATINRRLSLLGQTEAKIRDGLLEYNNKPVLKSKIDYVIHTVAEYKYKGWINVKEGCLQNPFAMYLAIMCLYYILAI